MTFGIGMNFGAGGSGSGQVVVITGQAQSIHLNIDQTGSVQIPAVDHEGDPLDFTGKTLRFVIRDWRKTILQTTEDAGIDRASGSFTIPLGLSIAANRRTLRWYLLDVTGGAENELIEGLFPVY